MHISYSELILLNKPVVENVKKLSEDGCGRIELMMDGQSWDSYKTNFTPLVRELKELNLSYSVHPAAWDINLTAETEILRRLFFETLPVKQKIIDIYSEDTVLQYALEQYTHCMEGVNVPDSVIEAFVTKIVVSRDSFDWYLRFDGDPDKPLHCQISGKRRQSTKIMVAGELSPRRG